MRPASSLRDQPTVVLTAGIGLGCALAVCTLLVSRRQSLAVALHGRRTVLATA